MKLTKTLNLVIVALVFLVCVGSSVLFLKLTKKDSEKDTLRAEAEAFQSKKLPKLPLRDLKNHKDYSDEINKGQVLLVYSISSCAACQKELQFISDSQQEVDSQTKVFAVMGEDEKVVEDYVERNNIKIPILIDADGSLLHKLDLKYFPSSFKLNDGVIKKVFFGFPQDKKSLIELANY